MTTSIPAVACAEASSGLKACRSSAARDLWHEVWFSLVSLCLQFWEKNLSRTFQFHPISAGFSLSFVDFCEFQCSFSGSAGQSWPAVDASSRGRSYPGGAGICTDTMQPGTYSAQFPSGRILSQVLRHKTGGAGSSAAGNPTSTRSTTPDVGFSAVSRGKRSNHGPSPSRAAAERCWIRCHIFLYIYIHTLDN